MKRIPKKIQEHLLSLILVAILLSSVVFIIAPRSQIIKPPELYNELEFVNYNDPLHYALLKDMLQLYQPGQPAKNDSLLKALVRFSEMELKQLGDNNVRTTPFRFNKSIAILWMYLKFILIYVLVVLLTYYGVQTLAVWMFIRKGQNKPPFIISLIEQVKKFSRKQGWVHNFNALSGLVFIFIKGLFRAFWMAALFTPAYVTAYSIKSDFNTDSILFMILLAVISNGLLITYANKFFTLLLSESRKGYVLTARVKNLQNSYSSNDPEGIPLKSVLAIHKNFKGHVFNHIFMNARLQYLETIKEQASFVISGLVIIEMALNIHGQFTYELMQQLLYKNYHYVLLMVLGIFVLVKLTEIVADYLKYRQLKRMET